MLFHKTFLLPSQRDSTSKVYVLINGHASPKPAFSTALPSTKVSYIFAENEEMLEVSTSLQAFECLKNHYNSSAEEVWILALNSQMKLLKKEMLFRGTVDHCLLHPRDIFRLLVLCNASSFIMSHNHPSGDCNPSEQDLAMTRKIDQLAQMIEIPLNDHIITTSENYFSMADNGFFKSLRRRKRY